MLVIGGLEDPEKLPASMWVKRELADKRTVANCGFVHITSDGRRESMTLFDGFLEDG